MMRVAFLTLGVVVALAVTVGAVGYSLPVQHRAVRSALVPTTQETVYALLADIEQYPRWRGGVTAVERVATPGAALRYREFSGGDAILYEVIADEPPRRRVTRIADPGLPFGGQWTYELAREGTGTRVRITEDGEVYNPVFRFVSRFVLGHTRTLDRFLSDLSLRIAARAGHGGERSP